MPFNDFICPGCDHVEEYKYYPMPEYDAAHNRITPWPICPCCTNSMEFRPTGMTHDLLPPDFGEVDVDGKVHTFSSLSEVRTFEEESIKRHRNGEGNPYIFRKLSQDRNHFGRNTLTDSEYERNRAAPRPSKVTQSNLPIAIATGSIHGID